ncbi:phosphate acetyltransferase [Corynebacterium sp. TAE3-ERU12]|nr:phosphate acetyltransferase [Corynebacterium sp. TAE3-ERU12]
MHLVGVPGEVSVDTVVDNPEVALSRIVASVEESIAADPSPAILIATGNLEFDSRAAAATGSGLVLSADASGCTDAAALTRIRMAIAEARKHRATPLALLLLGEAPESTDDELDLKGIDVPVATMGSDKLSELLRPCQPTVSPHRFQWWLTQQAKVNRRRIVLPEGGDDRIITAAARIQAADFCDLTILGDPDAMQTRAQELGLDISKAEILNPETSDLREKFAEQFAELRKDKGVTVDDARETMRDISYFATMMIHNDMADGMVSGAANTTAHTIKPSFQIIKTKPGVNTVSSLFFMVMDGLLWGFADCAVLPNPTPEQLGEIAVNSAETASNFGLEPKVAMLSYSTGTSGTGEDVDRVVEALKHARKLDPNLSVDGPLQFDAAMNPSTAQKKMPDSEVAGKANVFVFPDLDAGNIGYKIAQRCGGALAIGPILQGLNKPVNDLSRGATVPDIVNTVAITAIQAGGQ